MSKIVNAGNTKCLECGKKLPERLGQKFCNPNCKSAFHYRNSKLKEPSLYVRVERQLKLNRMILKQHFLSGKTILDKEGLIIEGYDFYYFTQTGKDKTGKEHWYAFEFGLFELEESGKFKLKVWKDKVKK